MAHLFKNALKVLFSKMLAYCFRVDLRALQGALWRSGGGGKRKQSLQLRHWNLFEYLPRKIHRQSRCEMLIGRDDISNDVITLGTCFSMVVYIRARFRFALTAQSKGSHRDIGGGIQIPETYLQAPLPFPRPLLCTGENDDVIHHTAPALLF